MSAARPLRARAGRTGGSVLLAATVLVALVQSVPGVAPDRVAAVVRPAAAVAGLDQGWRMFAPFPRTDGVRVEAVTRWSDGATTVWGIPERDPMVGAYSDYRWRKWWENAAADDPGRRLWAPAARYVARRLPRRPGAVPVQLSIVRSFAPVAAPGRAAGSAAPWRQEVYRASLTTVAR